jgi:ABC-type branched-subunit amino acid transport system substrate-binding protein
MSARSILPIGLLGTLAWLLPATIAFGAGARPLTLGLIAPPGEWDATSLRRGVELAVAEANGSGDGTVALDVQGEDGQWGTVGNSAVALVCAQHVDALITPSDGAAAHLILQVAGRTRVPVASLCSDSSVTEAGVPWAIRVVPRTDQEAAALFAATRRTEGSALHWWAVVPAGHPGKVVRRDLEAAARLTTTPLDRIIDGDDPKTDAASVARQIVAGAPAGILLWLPPAQAGALAAALREAGYGGRLAGPSVLDSPAFAAAAGRAAGGVLIPEFGLEDDPRVRAERFADQFRRRYGARPDASAAAAYDAARVLIETLHRAGGGASYRQFPVTFSTAGVTGVLQFDNLGNRTGPLLVLTCREGRFIPIPPDQP